MQPPLGNRASSQPARAKGALWSAQPRFVQGPTRPLQHALLAASLAVALTTAPNLASAALPTQQVLSIAAAPLSAPPFSSPCTLDRIAQSMSAYVLIAAEEEQLSGEAVAVTAAPTAAEDSATPVPAAATGDSATPVPAAAAPVKTELSYIELKALLKDCQDGNNCRVSKARSPSPRASDLASLPHPCPALAPPLPRPCPARTVLAAPSPG